MKIKQLLLLAICITLIGVESVSAQIVHTSSAPGQIVANGQDNGTIFADVNGDTKIDYPYPSLIMVKQTVGAPDPQGISRILDYEWLRMSYKDPITGATLGTTKTGATILVYDAPPPGAPGAPGGFGGPQTFEAHGIFTMGAKRYFTVLRSADTSGGVPAVQGSKYIDASVSAAIYDIATGAVIRRFTITSLPTWSLDIWDTGFADINGVTRFVESYMIRPAPTPPAPGANVPNTMLIRIWNATRTKLIKTFFAPSTFKFF